MALFAASITPAVNSSYKANVMLARKAVTPPVSAPCQLQQASFVQHRPGASRKVPAVWNIVGPCTATTKLSSHHCLGSPSARSLTSIRCKPSRHLQQRGPGYCQTVRATLQVETSDPALEERRDQLPVVNSHNEWSLLEEVIVGSVKGATIPGVSTEAKPVIKEEYHGFLAENAGKSFPQHLVDAAAKELDYLTHVLESEGVKVRRPHIPRDDEFSRPVTTPDFECQSQLYAAMPRDNLIVIGNEIIEAPMAWRSRYFEYRPYRKLVKAYFRQGAKWTAAPKPQMSDELYAPEDSYIDVNGDAWSTTEFEPIFDAAEFMRFGRDIFTQRSSVTNYTGIQWMQRHLGDEYRIHVLDFKTGPGTMHLDADFVPLAPGKLLLCPARPCQTGEHRSFFTFDGQQKELRLPAMFKGWDIFQGPKPQLDPKTNPLYMTSPWISTTNILSIDEKRILIEAGEKEGIRAFRSWGFEPIPVPLRNFMAFGGSFHCATVDVRRRSTLESYF